MIDSLDPNFKPLVAGGAPRDWDEGKPANDVDIWLCRKSTKPYEVIDTVEAYYRGKGVTDARTDIILSYAQDGSFIDTIINFKVFGVELQFIFVEDSCAQEVVGRFCCNLSEAIWDYKKNVIMVSPKYTEGRRTKTLRLWNSSDHGYRRVNEGYVDKIAPRYPDYTVELIEDDDKW